MSWIVKVLLAVVVGLVVAGVLNYFGVLNHSLNALLGVLAAILTYFQAPWPVS